MKVGYFSVTSQVIDGLATASMCHAGLQQPSLGLYEKQVTSPFWLAGVNCSFSMWCKLTFTGIALSDQSNHQGCAVAALGGAGEGLDAELVCFGLQKKPRKTNQVTRH